MKMSSIVVAPQAVDKTETRVTAGNSLIASALLAGINKAASVESPSARLLFSTRPTSYSTLES
jgi:hypothetical protein